MVLRHKPRNCRCDFEAQITKLELPVLRPKPENPTHRFWGQTERNRRHRFWDQSGENRPRGFESKPLINYRPWFWGSTNKLTLLIITCTVQTAHNITRPLDRPATDYPTCATISDPVHQVSYYCHDPRHCTPCHLHTTRQATRFSVWNRDKSKTIKMSQIWIQTSICQWLITYQIKVVITWFLKCRWRWHYERGAGRKYLASALGG
jgi:hypothetical protein